MSVCIGLDAHARTCTYKAKNDNGDTVETKTIPSTKSALTELAETYPGATVVLEASAVHEWIYDTLTDHGINVFPAHPVNIRRTLGKKNDELDAGFLVDAYRIGALPRSYVPPPHIRQLRELARRRAFLVQQRTRYKNRIHGILKRRGVRFIDPDGQEDTAVFTTRNRKRLEAVGPEVVTLLELIDDLSARIRETNHQITSTVHSTDEIRRLTTIPGFGDLTALIVYAEIGDHTRFPHPDSVASYFGLVPSEHQSGDTHHRGRITGRGSSLAQWVLNQAAWAHVRSCPDSNITKAYKRIQKRAGKKRAIVAVSRRLAVTAFCILRDGSEFRING